MARLEQVLVNGTSVTLGSGLEGRIAQEIDRSGAGSCVIVKIRVKQKSFSFAFPRGCAGGGGGGGGGGASVELNRLIRIYESTLEKLDRSAAALRGAVLEFIKSL